MTEYNYGEFVGLDGPHSLELSYEPYQSYEVGVWSDDSGWYLGTDSTCSCYTAFENYSRDDLTGPMSREDAISEVTNLWNDAYYYGVREESWLTEFIDTTFSKKENN